MAVQEFHFLDLFKFITLLHVVGYSATMIAVNYKSS